MQHIHSNPDILGGIPCFTGTRVPVETLFDHLSRGYTLDAYLAQFPTVKREHAVGVLDQASKSINTQTLRAAG